MALRLYGITAVDDHGAEPPPEGIRTVSFRDLAAVVAEAPYAAVPADDETIASHREVVETLFTARTLLPAPPGVAFRTPQALQRWMELHYVALSDALAYIDDRAGARVHIVRADGLRAAADASTDLVAAAAECMRALRRQAVAGLPLRTEHQGDLVLSSAFLVEREAWKDFAGAVRRVAADHAGFRVELTGPWPPYDFVRIEFGG
jgi:gas vesicle protein GvpL/GvpF